MIYWGGGGCQMGQRLSSAGNSGVHEAGSGAREQSVSDQHIVHSGEDGQFRPIELCGEQGWSDWTDQDCGQGTRSQGHQGQCHSTRIHSHSNDATSPSHSNFHFSHFPSFYILHQLELHEGDEQVQPLMRTYCTILHSVIIQCVCLRKW